MKSDEIVDQFRTEMGDRTLPYLWSDAEVYGYLDQAQTDFCRNTDGISDSRTPAVCNLAIVPGTDWYTTHTAILNVRRITRADTGRKVEALTAEQADSRGIVFLAALKGVVKQVVFGFEPHAVRIAPMPTETVTLNLQVWRLPLVAITDLGGQVLEIDAQHHVPLLNGMKGRAYDKQDIETFDRRKSDDFTARFKAYCDKAQQEQARARRVLGNVAYGGI